MTQPLTRDMSATVAALEISEAELLFQATRLEDKRTASTEQESEHHADLRKGYDEAAKYIRILLNYHRGRMRNSRSRPVQQTDAIDARGMGRAHVEDEG